MKKRLTIYVDGGSRGNPGPSGAGVVILDTGGKRLKDISKYEDVLSGVLESGANYVEGIEFRTTELRKYRDQARVMAIKAAKDRG